MRTLHVFRVLGPVDARNIRRDSLLRWMILFPFAIALLIRWLVPLLAEQLTFVDIRLYYPLILSYFFILMTPMMLGLVIGFLLLDERDDRTLLALQVTPLSLNQYLLYRTAAPLLLSLVITLLAFPIASLAPTDYGSLLLVALLSAPLAPIFALALPALADNKVQGFALTKVTGIFLIIPIIAYFVPSNWQLLAGLVPTYWPVKLGWVLSAGDPAAPLYFIAGALYDLGLLWVLLRRFHQVMHR